MKRSTSGVVEDRKEGGPTDRLSVRTEDGTLRAPVWMTLLASGEDRLLGACGRGDESKEQSQREEQWRVLSQLQSH